MFLELLRNETAQSPDRRAAALAGLRRYQELDRGEPRTMPPAIARSGRASLRAYADAGQPVVFVPSLINPPFVLDLMPGNSLIAQVAGAGLRPLLVDWSTPTAADRDQDVTAHVEQLLLPLLDALDRPPILVGYCLGGTLALAAAALRPVAGLALIATPWHFARYGSAALAEIDAMWDQSAPSCDVLGLVPMEVLQSGFWKLDPSRTIAKYERFASIADGDPTQARAFAALEDWANQGAPLTFAAGRQLFDDFFAADLPGSGRWQVAGHTIRPESLACPAIEFVSTTDRIVPAATAVNLADRHETHAGHVGMVVGSRARSALWEPLVHWLGSISLPT